MLLMIFIVRLKKTTWMTTTTTALAMMVDVVVIEKRGLVTRYRFCFFFLAFYFMCATLSHCVCLNVRTGSAGLLTAAAEDEK